MKKVLIFGLIFCILKKLCGYGGIGRRSALRSLWMKIRGSSSLLNRTKKGVRLGAFLGALTKTTVSCFGSLRRRSFLPGSPTIHWLADKNKPPACFCLAPLNRTIRGRPFGRFFLCANEESRRTRSPRVLFRLTAAAKFLPFGQNDGKKRCHAERM